MNKRYFKIAILILFSLSFLFIFKPSEAIIDIVVDQEIEELNTKIQLQKKQIEQLQSRQKEYQAQITAKRNEQVTISNQLTVMEERLIATELDIEETGLSLGKLDLEIQKIKIDTENVVKKIDGQKGNISDLLRLMYKQEQSTTLEALLLNSSLSDFLSQLKYLENVNIKINDVVDELKKQQARLESNRSDLEFKNQEMKVLQKKLEEKKDNLIYEQNQKSNILEQTKSSEKAFQELLAKAKLEQNQAQAEISKAENLIRQKMSQKDKSKLESSDSSIGWPVAKNYVVATFHDPDYPYRKIIGEHSGIDIRSAQGSSLYAAADGYVAKVKFDGSKNYGYIMIIHGDNLSTVYGHISAAYVSVDDYVTRGQLIGKTGGTPGTPGSGSFSTGPHLHFEVRKNGLPVNPQNYLP